MNKSQLLIAALSIVVPIHLPAEQNPIPLIHNKKPNIIFVLVDDLGYGDIGVFYQNERAEANNRNEPWHSTPNLDALANEGIQLRGHYSPAPVCAPSRASLLTGVHQGHSSIRDNQFDKALENNHTLGTVLQAAGYTTAAIGKWGLQGSGNDSATWPAYPTKRGFDYFFGYVRHGDGHVHYAKEGSAQRDPVQLWDQDREISATLDKAYTTDLFTARAKKWIVDQTNADATRPFFIYLAYDAPHATIEVPTQAYPQGGGVNGGLQWTGQSGSIINTASGVINSYYHPDYATATWDHDSNPATPEVAWPDVYKGYATMVRRIDDAIGDIVQTLKDLDIDNETLIVFTSDNGVSNESYIAASFNPEFFSSFGPFDGIKRDLWEGGIRVGALVRWPAAIPAGQISEAPSQFHDWLPTFTAAAGLPAPARTDGVSLLPTLTAGGEQQPGIVYAEYQYSGNTPNYALFAPEKRNQRRGQMQMLRIGDYVGVRYNIQSHSDPFKIYDISSDPQQLNNIATKRQDLQQVFSERALRIRVSDSSAPRPYDNEAVAAVSPAQFASGVHWQWYDTESLWLPRLDHFTTASELEGDALEIAPAQLPATTGGAVLYSGYIQIPDAGSYTFYLNTDGKALLRLHDATVIDADYGYGGGAERSGSITLSAGKHPFRLYYQPDANASAEPALQLHWSRSGSNALARQLIPAAAFFRDGEGAVVPPTAVDDFAATGRGASVIIDALANDFGNNQPQEIHIQSVSTPQRGTASITAEGITYTPHGDFLGTERFGYTISNGAQTASATISVRVTDFNGDYWFPLDHSSGFTASDASGAVAAILHGFSDADSHWVSGNFGNALRFDGNNDYVSIPGFNGVLGSAPRTISAWVRSTYSGGNGNLPIVAWGPNSQGNKWTFLLTTDGQLRLEATGGWVVGTSKINNGQWHHVAVSFAPSATPSTLDIKLYVNGSEETISSSQRVAINTTASGDVKIGSDVQSRFWLGDIAQVRIYPRALSGSEINTLSTISDPQRQAWHTRYFGSAAESWTSDDDADGLDRTAEYAFGLQPFIKESSSILTPVTAPDGSLQVTFPRRASTGPQGIRYQLEGSTDLQSWAPAEATLLQRTAIDGDYEQVTYRVTNPAQSDRYFVRLQVSLP